MYTSTRAKDSLARIIKLKLQVVHARSSCGRWGPTATLSLFGIVSAITTFSTLDSKDGWFLWSVGHPRWLFTAWRSTWRGSFCGAVFRFHTWSCLRAWSMIEWRGWGKKLKSGFDGLIQYNIYGGLRAYELCRTSYIQHPYITDVRLVLPYWIRWESWYVAMRPSRYSISIQWDTRESSLA